MFQRLYVGSRDVSRLRLAARRSWKVALSTRVRALNVFSGLVWLAGSGKWLGANLLTAGGKKQP